MNYKKQYQMLVARANNRNLVGYCEKHHIIPKCMGGSNDSSNIAVLTAREHFIAHLLLSKMYPENLSLIRAIAMMCVGREDRKHTNRLYGISKLRHKDAMSESQTGSKNSQFGTRWIYNAETKISKKIKRSEPILEGWKEGRKLKFDTRQCVVCGSEIMNRKAAIYCDTHRVYVKPDRIQAITKPLAKIEKNGLTKEVSRNQVPSYVRYGWKRVD